MRGNTEGTELSFNGCLRNLRMNNQRVGGEHEAFSLIRCSENVEPGIFFPGGLRSHVVLRMLTFQFFIIYSTHFVVMTQVTVKGKFAFCNARKKKKKQTGG